ncbi:MULTISPECIES: FAD-binding and (Fe-S)-binding domain-containing protein [unclassified Shewanella]|uniref:D-2-hydroxyglutarate dehydrogenase YdiJ n=1 Tax=unclassified Shewanella TaxID=196818 RepID=UPI001BBC4D7C|nr:MULTISPECIES: FAD-binding and (Fe-S)-binding domain-containing protein [unclassified Shewanella]GIU12885.1 membrane protein [Shewanella sp. MBTL60-112-B1]GIU38244.1 membrane protein [Shewanella sp. MBTL60-112-B2]
MLPKLSHQQTLEPTYLSFLSTLEEGAFSGDIDTRYSARLAQATDNSVYQFLPQAVIYPKSADDVQIALKLASQDEFAQVVFSARGGGTGTNGQSLTHGIIIDMSRYMNQVLEVNATEGWVKVQAGVVKDALNDALRPHGFFFSPDLSTSNRATLGGMINTDASGAGSLVYGKTSDHVLGLSSILFDGSELISHPVSNEQLADIESVTDNVLGQQLISSIADMCKGNRERIEQRFPKLNRFLTGYDLKNVWDDKLEHFDLSRIITGSEGTLAVITEAKLNITPLPTCRMMVNIKYDSFESALRHAPDLVKANATVVETVDSKVLNLAKQDIIWHSVSSLIKDVPGKEIDGLNMVEFAGELADVKARVANLEAMLTAQISQSEAGLLGYQVTSDKASINTIYAMRKKAVGLLGAAKGTRKPIAFAEDTAVPPEKLADFILEFRALLDSHQLQYGMFGHVDAGVLHVRPALDMCDEQDERLLKTISDQVADLTLKYGGLMWGEHGKGVRGEYGPAVFGEHLYGLLEEVKGLFDPKNKLNPGKLVAPKNSGPMLYNVDSAKRGAFDRQIPLKTREAFPDVMNCNGNGLCFNYSVYSPMCPSFKVTGDRIHSPKGRAGLMREWLRLLEAEGVDVNELARAKPLGWLQRAQNTLKMDKEYDYSHEVMESLKGCLACKACSSQCPVKVDVPKFRAQFFDIYYQRYLRPAKDYLVAGIEDSLPLMAAAPRLVNAVSQNSLSKWVIKKSLGYVDSPALSVPTLKQRLEGHSSRGYDLAALQQIPENERSQYVLVVQDPFNSFYEAGTVYHFVQLIEKLGLKPILLPFKPNGKPIHIKGFLDKFARTAKSTADFLNQVAKLNMPMVGIDPALVLCYRDEYAEVLGGARGNFHVQLANEWLLEVVKNQPKREAGEFEFTWFSHCTESTAKPNTANEWQAIFDHFGAKLNTVNLGCCGMAGTYGHEAENLERSKALYTMSWEQTLSKLPKAQVLISGYSCRSQVKRFSGFKPKHPLEALMDLL